MSARSSGAPPARPSGLVIVDKPGGMTSHDVVARIRRLAGTRRVGHAGTLDPMATGVLVVGVEKATRLLGHLMLTEKEYSATIRLGQATDSSGTYTRALARDLGDALGVGGHLTMLRRTRVGPYDLSAARSLDELASGLDQPGAELEMVSLEDAAAAAFPSRVLTEPEARSLAHGASLPWTGPAPGPVAAFGPEGTLIALVAERGGTARPLAVFVP